MNIFGSFGSFRTRLGLALALAAIPQTAVADDGQAGAPATPPPAGGQADEPSKTGAATGEPAGEPSRAAAGSEYAGEHPKPVATASSATDKTAAAAPKPPPYSLPWQLRPVTVGNVLRSDTSVAFFDAKNAMTGESRASTTVSSMLLATYKLTYSRVIDAPWSNNGYQMVQLDVP